MSRIWVVNILGLIFYTLPRNKTNCEDYSVFWLLDEVEKCNIFEKQNNNVFLNNDTILNIKKLSVFLYRIYFTD
jgi:hypothetical protein